VNIVRVLIMSKLLLIIKTYALIMSTTYALSPPIWREPKQARSRQRVEAILRAASKIIVEKGLDGLQMRELGKQADVPIGTLYQFFDDREAILACLVARYLAWQDEEITQRFQNIDSVEGWLTAIEGAIAVFYQRNLQDPAVAEILQAGGSSQVIREIDNASTKRHTQLLFDMSRPFLRKQISDRDLELICQMVCELTAAAVRMALQKPRSEGERYIHQFEEMIRARLAELTKATAT
jgi:AcrR family transcriptional regulator